MHGKEYGKCYLEPSQLLVALRHHVLQMLKLLAAPVKLLLLPVQCFEPTLPNIILLKQLFDLFLEHHIVLILQHLSPRY